MAIAEVVVIELAFLFVVAALLLPVKLRRTRRGWVPGVAVLIVAVGYWALTPRSVGCVDVHRDIAMMIGLLGAISVGVGGVCRELVLERERAPVQPLPSARIRAPGRHSVSSRNAK